MKVASFDVDAQKGFTPLCPDELPVAGGEEIVDELNAQAKLAIFRVGSKDAHPEKAIWTADKDHPVLSQVLTANEEVDVYWPKHCVVGTKGFELLDGLPHPKEYDYFVYKGMEPDMHPYGAAFHDSKNLMSTGVIEFLEAQGVTHVIVGGLATDYCVSETVRQLAYKFTVIVNMAACRAVVPEDVHGIIATWWMKHPGKLIFVADNAKEITVILHDEEKREKIANLVKEK